VTSITRAGANRRLGLYWEKTIMSTGCSGKCPGCKKRQAAEGKAASLIQIAADKLSGSGETETSAESSTRGSLVAEILAHAGSFVL
jgi:hypothetical protein